jgi:hypothetical protein
MSRHVWSAVLTLWLAAAISSPAQAQVEDVLSNMTFSGYGEVHYNNPQIGTMDDDAPAEADVHRFVLGWGYEFSPEIRFDAEVDFEHSASEIELEYAHLDYDLGPTITLRTGSILMPVGPLNEFHEPPTFYSVERPYVENSIMPTTWQEIGVGIVGRAGAALGYRAYVVTGLNADGFSSLSGIRGGRGHGVEAAAEDLAGVARLEYALGGGLNLGASGYYGGADQSVPGLGDVTVGIVNVDARLRRFGFDLRGVFYREFLDGADTVSTAVGETVGSAIQGWYAEAAYDFLRRDLDTSRRRSFVAFARYEDFDTNEDTPDGFLADPAADRQVMTAGLAYFPIEKVAFKGDFEHWEDGTDAQLNRFNLGMAFMF